MNQGSFLSYFSTAKVPVINAKQKNTNRTQKQHKEMRRNAKRTNKVARANVTRMTKQKYKSVTVTKSPYPGRNCNNVSVNELQFVYCVVGFKSWNISPKFFTTVLFFDPIFVHLGFVVNNLALVYFYCEYLRVPFSLSSHQCPILIFILYFWFCMGQDTKIGNINCIKRT